MKHHTHVYHSLEAYLRAFTVQGKDLGKRIWKRHVEKRGNVPLIRKCSICSGKTRKLDIKYGSYTPKRPSKRLRVEQERAAKEAA